MPANSARRSARRTSRPTSRVEPAVSNPRKGPWSDVVDIVRFEALGVPGGRPRLVAVIDRNSRLPLGIFKNEEAAAAFLGPRHIPEVGGGIPNNPEACIPASVADIVLRTMRQMQYRARRLNGSSKGE